MLTILMGKTATGKDTILNKLVNLYQYHKIVTYTTRPIRENEINGKDYHFISEEEFFKKIEDNYFIEWKRYETKEGIWYYGSPLNAIKSAINSDLDEVVILTPDGIKDLFKKVMFKNLISVFYIYCSEGTMRERLANRGDKQEEIDRRIENDNIDFQNPFELANACFRNEHEYHPNDIALVINAFNSIY